MSDIKSLFHANKGEWSEIYTMFKIMDEREVVSAGSDLLPNGDETFKFLKIYRDIEAGIRHEYDITKHDEITIYNEKHDVLKVIKPRALKKSIAHIFQSIDLATERTFAIDGIEDIMSEYLLTQVKAGSTQKSDILGEVADRLGVGTRPLGFSVKSHIGGAPTLLNYPIR